MFDGRTVALRVTVSATLRLAVVLFSVIDSASVSFFVTVILQVADLFEPSVVVAVIVASPALTAVTTPLALTVATDVFDDFHVTDLFVVFDGRTVALRVSVSATLRLAVVLFNVIDSASVSFPPPDNSTMLEKSFQ